MRYQARIVTKAPETLTGLQPGQWLAYGAARGRWCGIRNGVVWIAWGATATRRFPQMVHAFKES